jgi:2-oxoglutarate ferredoxin oxidoreductase subunit delta
VVHQSPWEININHKWCKKCGLCVEFCPKNVLELADGLQIRDLDACIGCLMCEIHCPDFAIMVKRREKK